MYIWLAPSGSGLEINREHDRKLKQPAKYVKSKDHTTIDDYLLASTNSNF